MAAKLLRTLSDDNNSDMPKTIGCMAGIFHLFGRGHFLSKRRHVTNTPLPAPANNNNNNNNTISVVPTNNNKPENGLNNIVKDSILYRDVRGISVRTKQESPTLTYIDSPRPSLPTPKSTKSKLYGFRESMSPNSRFLHRKDSPRFSYDGRESKPTTFKIKELPPRYSLDSKRPTSPPPLVSEEHGSHRRQPSIVAKLMGLEDLEEMDHVSEESLYHPISMPEEKKPTAPSRRLELAPWKGTTVYGQIEKRLAQLEFHKSGKDLRALKQILQAMQNCEPKKESETLPDSGPTIIKRIASPKKSKSPTFTVKPTKIAESAKKPTSSCVVPVPGLRKLDLVDKKRVEKKQSQPTPEISRSPRQQKASFSKQPESAKKINQSRQAKSKSKAKPKLSYGGGSNGLGSDNFSSCSEQSNSISVQSDSINSQEEMEVSSAYTRQERKKTASRIREDDFITKSPTPEQPSPVSVLDAISFEDEPPSPVPMINRDFQDVEPLSYNKTPEKTEPKFTSTSDEGYSRLGIMYLSPMKPIQHNKEINSPEDGYISEILLASGLLNSGKSKYIDEIQKRLVSDVVNELLIENIASDRSIPSVPQQKQLLKRLCSEIDELQCELDEEGDDCFRKMLEKDFCRRSMNWKLGFGDNSGMVLDIERMVFRDLIWEIVSSEAIDLRAGYMKPRRQLFKN